MPFPMGGQGINPLMLQALMGGQQQMPAMGGQPGPQLPVMPRSGGASQMPMMVPPAMPGQQQQPGMGAMLGGAGQNPQMAQMMQALKMIPGQMGAGGGIPGGSGSWLNSMLGGSGSLTGGDVGLLKSMFGGGLGAGMGM